MDKTDRLTFRDLDGNILLPDSTSALEDWYISVRDIDLKNMDLIDLARACRQGIYLEYIVPLCLNELEKNPCAGALYDGELVYSMKNIPATYWKAHPDQKDLFLQLASVAQQTTGDEELRITEADLDKKS